MVDSIKSYLFEKISGIKEATPLRPDLESSYQNVYNIICRLSNLGESNSLLIIGSEGSGKSFILNKALSDNLKAKHKFLLVKLNGLLQTDDRVALEEITRQLQLENVVKDKVFGSFAENLSFLLDALKTGNNLESMPVLIIIENFEMFAAHKNQTLLYNLFDISQTSATPLSVIGTTCRLDVLELLEKRVKSRFCHRQIFITNKWSESDFINAFVTILHLPSDFKMKTLGKTEQKKVIQKWNKNVENLIKNKQVIEVLKKLFVISKEVRLLLELIVLPLSRLNDEDHLEILPDDVNDSYISLVTSDPKANLVHSLSIVELCLVIAMQHLYKHSQETGLITFNFHEVYNEFLKFSSKKSNLLHTCSKHMIIKAFERLKELEIVRPYKCSLGGKGRVLVAKDYIPMMLLLDSKQVEEAVNKYPDCPTYVQRWSQSSLA